MDMDELKSKRNQAKIALKSLTSKKRSQRTADDIERIGELRFAIAGYDAEIEKAKFADARAKAAEMKDKATLKNLHEAGITTENGVKALLLLRDVCYEFGITDAGKLRIILSTLNNQTK